jgi:hypothetical protein
VFYYTPGVLNNSYTLTPSITAASSDLVRNIAGALTSINTTYILNTNPMNFDGAQAYCNDMGGHLTSYGSSQEQVRGQHTAVGGLRMRAHPGSRPLLAPLP